MTSVQMTTNAKIVPASLKDVIVTQIRQILMNFVQQIKSVSNVNALKRDATAWTMDFAQVTTSARIVPAFLKDVIVIQILTIQMNSVLQIKSVSSVNALKRDAIA